MRKIADEIAELIPKGSMSDAVEEPEEDEQPEPEPQQQEPEEPEASPEPEESEPVDQEPPEPEEEGEEDDEPDEYEMLRAQNAEMREALESVLLQLGQGGAPQQVQQQTQQQEQPQQRDVQPQTEETRRAQAPWEMPAQLPQMPEFVSEEEFEDLLVDRNRMNKKMSEYMQQIVQAARQAAIVDTVQTIVPFTTNQVQFAFLLERFMNENPHLRKVQKQFLQSVQNVEREHGDWRYEDQIFPEAEKRLSEGLQKALQVLKAPPPAGRQAPQKQSPAFVKPRGSRVTPKPKTGQQTLQEQIAELVPQRRRY